VFVRPERLAMWVVVAVGFCARSARSQPTTTAADGDGAAVVDPLPPELLGFSLADGVRSESAFLAPGKIDFLYRRREDANEAVLFGWSPVFKGGVGTVDPDGSGSTEYYGGYVRPLVGRPDFGELIVGGLAVDPDLGARAYEVQGEYRLPCGLGAGGGMVERSQSDVDVEFAKLTMRGALFDSGWSYIAALLGQQVDDDVSPGAYLALHDDSWMGVAGSDGEQWRAVLGWNAPPADGWLRPGGEVLWVDNSIGEIDGPRFLFVNATLRYSKGFLSHGARLGRAMGPQGVEYGNPLGFLAPTWNRRLEVQELGGVVDYRLVRSRFPTGAISEKHELLVFPLQALRCESPLDGLFVGGFWDRDPVESSPGVQAGWIGRAGFLDLDAAIEWATETDLLVVTIGIIDGF